MSSTSVLKPDLSQLPPKRRYAPPQHQAYSAAQVLAKASSLLAQGLPVVLAAVIRHEGSAPRRAGARMLVTQEGEVYGSIGGGCVEAYVAEEATKVYADSQPRLLELDLGDDSWSGIGMACGGKVEIAVERIDPTARVVILGGGHIAKVLAAMARQVDWQVIVVDPYAGPADYPEAAQVFSEGYEEGITKLRLTPSDAIVIVTRHQLDAPALKAALSTLAGYVGMVSSRNRRVTTFQQLEAEGVPRDQLERVYAPVGLDIGAETPGEIALSILAELLLARKGGTGAPKVLTAAAKA